MRMMLQMQFLCQIWALLCHLRFSSEPTIEVVSIARLMGFRSLLAIAYLLRNELT